jgi:hypothetical protein
MTPPLDGDPDSASAPPAFDPTDLTSVAKAAWGDLLTGLGAGGASAASVAADWGDLEIPKPCA